MLLITFCFFSLAILEASANKFRTRTNTFSSANELAIRWLMLGEADPNLISSMRVTDWGVWSPFESCNEDSFVIGFRQKVEKKHNGDNTALNAIELICNDNKRIRGATGDFGNWGDEKMCENNQGAIGFRLKQHASQNGGDNTAANALRLLCQDNSMISVDNDGEFGKWSSAIRCSANHVICGLRVQIQPPQGDGVDDTSLNNVEFQCCLFKEPSPMPTSIDLINETDENDQIIVDPASLDPSPKAIKGTIESDRITNFGDWFGWAVCDQGSHVIGFRQKVDLTDADRTSLNGIELICSNNKRIFSAQMTFGKWSEEVRCPRGQRVFAFNLKQQRNQGAGDDTAANDIRLFCININSSQLTALNADIRGEFGDFSRRSIICPRDSFICGIRVQIQRNQGAQGDDTALNNVDFQCCD